MQVFPSPTLHPSRDPFATEPQGTAHSGQGARAQASADPASGSEHGGVRVTLSGEALARSESGEELSREDQKKLLDLKKRDREVRAHEAAHQAAAGSLARGGASFTYETGPDGKRYAVGGEVSIDASPVPGDPQATARKMERVRAAALAPADPSGQDRQVAARAAMEAQAARSERAEEDDEAKAGCPLCGDGAHGPEHHAGEIDTRV